LNFNIFNSLVLTGIVQGIVFAFVVAASKKYRFPGTLILATFILSFSFDNLQYYLEDVGLITEEELWSIYFVPFQLLSGPLFLLYGLFVINPERKFKKQDLLLFIPFVIAFVVNSAYKIAHALSYKSKAFENFFDTMESMLEYCSLIFDFTVLVYLYVKVAKHQRLIGVANTKLVSPQLSWFKMVLIWLFGLSIIWLGVTILDFFFDTEYWYLVYIGMSGVIYWMGHVGIYKYGLYEERKQIRNYSIKNETYQIREKPKNEHIAAMEKLVVDGRMFLDANLTLDKIAEELHISKSHLSRIINSELGSGFPDYINSLRVQEAKKYLSNPAFSNYTLVAIGLEAGFNSKTTFNNAFKKITGLTPSDFQRQSRELVL
jgi:AraC-like DNA-binding protein